jgi:hypothetical protein
MVFSGENERAMSFFAFFFDVCSVLNEIGLQMDSFKYLFVINAQKKRNIQYTCQKRIET